MVEDTRKTHRIACCYGVIFLSWASTYLYAPTLPTFAASLGMSNAAVGLITSGFGLMQALLRAPLGILSDRLGKRRVLVNLSMLAAFACPLAMAIWPVPGSLILFRFLSGITAAAWPILTVLVSSYFDDSQSPAIISRCNLFNSLGNMAGMLAGGIIVAALGQVAGFFLASAVGWGALLLSFFLPERSSSAQPAKLHDLLRAFTHKRLLYLSLLAAVFQLVITGTSTSFTPIYAAAIGADSFQLGVLGVLSMAGMGIASLLRRPLSRILSGTRNLLIFCFLVLALSTAAIPFCLNIWPLYLTQLIQGTSGYMILIVLMGECIAPYPADERVSAMGVFQSIFGMGMFVGPFLSGVLYDVLPAAGVFWTLAGLAGLACLAVVVLYIRMDGRER